LDRFICAKADVVMRIFLLSLVLSISLIHAAIPVETEGM